MHVYIDPFNRPWQGNLDGVGKAPSTTRETLLAREEDPIHIECRKVQANEKAVREAMTSGLRVLREALHDRCAAEGGHMFRVWAGGHPECDRCGLKGWEAKRWIEAEQHRLSATSAGDVGTVAPPVDGDT